jgi:TniQ
MVAKDRLLLFSAIPHLDESFIGYLLRLKEVNRYQTLSWILQLAGIKNYARSSFSFAFNGSLDVSPLARLTGVKESALASMLYVPLRLSEKRMMGDYSVFGSSVPHYIIQTRKPKLCPSCLRESNYARKIWELAPVTVCALHQCLLLDECRSCGKRITWNRTGISRCRCGFDWRDHETALVDDSELAVTRQIHLLCNLSVDSQTAGEFRSNNPLYELGLRQFISALIFVASQLDGAAQRKGQRTIDTKGKHFAPSKSSAEIHALLCKALPVFDDWPNNYYSFLDWRRGQQKAREDATTSSHCFAGYKSALFLQLASDEFEFMRIAFREYRSTRRYEAYVASSGSAGNISAGKKGKTHFPTTGAEISIAGQMEVEISKLHGTHVSGKKARGALKTTWPGLKGLIASGKLKAIVGRKGEQRLFLVEKASLEELKEKLERSLFLKQVERLLGVHFERIKELIECSLLNPLRGPEVDGCSDWRFDQNEITGLVERLTRGLSRKRGPDKKKALSFRLVLRKIGRAGISLGTLLQSVLDGEIKPCSRSKENGLRSLLFREKQITDYVKSELRLLIGDTLSLPEAAKLLGVTRSAINFLVKNNFLHAEKFASAPPLGLFVKREEFDLFNEKYLLVREMASKHGTSSAYIVNLLSKQGVQPVSGPKVDGGRIYLVEKIKIEVLDLPSLISEEKKQAIAERTSLLVASLDSKGSRTSISSSNYLTPKAAQWLILDEQQAAEALKLDVEAIRQLAETGSLRPHKRLSGDKLKAGKYYFSSYIIQKYKSRSADHSGLIAFLAAAKLLNLYPDNFYNKYVKTGRLKPVLAKGPRCEHFFRLRDVEVLLEIERQTIMTPEAAAVLEVNVSCIDKMIASGILKPISGPGIDGFGKNLFLRSDVEKLHAEIESFKAKRIKEGKTSRFGRGKDIHRCPVRAEVGPHIDRLIKQWSTETPRKQISGPRVFRQLVRNGYKVGINTVYVYLREQLLGRGL